MNSIFEGIEIVSTGVERESSTKCECDKKDSCNGIPSGIIATTTASVNNMVNSPVDPK